MDARKPTENALRIVPIKDSLKLGFSIDVPFTSALLQSALPAKGTTYAEFDLPIRLNTGQSLCGVLYDNYAFIESRSEVDGYLTLYFTDGLTLDGVPVGYANALEWPDTDAVPWPDVLMDWQFYQVLNQAATKIKDLLTYNLRNAFTGDVKTTNKLWWQPTAYAITPPTPMVASGIRVDGNLMSFSIPPCLHAFFDYYEQNYLLTEAGLERKSLLFHFNPTDQTDWPATITVTKQQPKSGGFQVVETIYYRPDNFAAATTEVTVEDDQSPDYTYYG